ncbi:MAG: hypothetical protein RH942_19065 [Kiloniellaceae bacterium]
MSMGLAGGCRARSLVTLWRESQAIRGSPVVLTIELDSERVTRAQSGYLSEAARLMAHMEVADAVAEALNSYDGSLRDLQKASGLDPAFVSKLASGKVNKQGATVASLAQIALVMDKTLKITIE